MGLPALAVPDVPGARAVWLEQLAKLEAAPGADSRLLGQLRLAITDGVKTAFVDGTPPSPKSLPNTSAFRRNFGVCMERLRVYEDMAGLRRVVGLPPPGAHVQPMHAVVREGKKARVCVDLAQNFNEFVEDGPFRMASVQDGVDLAKRARASSGRPAWLVKLDISSCFLSFPIHPDDRHMFYCQAGGSFYQWLALVFGRKDAPRVVTQLLDVVSSALADAGLAHVRYLDDYLLVATTRGRAWACAHAAASIIAAFGLALSVEKTEGPSTCLEFLGIVIDTVREVLEISVARQAELGGLLSAFSKRRDSSVRRLQSLLGKLSFAATVLPGARPFLRRIIDVVSGRTFGTVKLGAAFRSEVRYWRDHVAQWNGRCGWRAPSAEAFVFASDASTSGFAYGLESCPAGAVAQLDPSFQPGTVRSGSWSAAAGHAAIQQHSDNIQWGEFFCPLAAATEYAHRLRGQHLVFVIDNQSDVAVINRQRTREPRVAQLLRALCDLSLRFNFTFAAVHRYGEDNVLMDWASRPDYHKFGAVFSRAEGAPVVVVVGGGGAYPPLLIPTSITHISSRCLSFASSGNSTSWTSSSGGWSCCAAA